MLYKLAQKTCCHFHNLYISIPFIQVSPIHRGKELCRDTKARRPGSSGRPECWLPRELFSLSFCFLFRKKDHYFDFTAIYLHSFSHSLKNKDLLDPCPVTGSVVGAEDPVKSSHRSYRLSVFMELSGETDNKINTRVKVR